MSSNAHINLLIIDNDEADVIVTQQMLQVIDNHLYQLDWCCNYHEGLNKALSDNYDVVLINYQLNSFNGIDLIRELSSYGSNTPLILLTSYDSQEIDIAAMEAGATDYLAKSELNSYLLERTIRYAINHKKAEQRLKYLARYDTLTNLPNRYLFQKNLQRGIAHAQRNQTFLGLLYIDLDNFKTVNDTLGHAAGDILLQLVAGRLSDCSRSDDSVARLGGDEFTVILEEIKTPEAAAIAAQRIIDALNEPFNIKGNQVLSSPSIGIAIYPLSGKSAFELIKNADISMYSAKRQGANCYQFFTHEINQKNERRTNIVNYLHNAIENEEFRIKFQPQVALSTGETFSLKAIIEWHNPSLGFIPAHEFMSIAEESGHVVKIGSWLFTHVCAQFADWCTPTTKNCPLLYLNIRFSSAQLLQKHFIANLLQTLKRHHISPSQLIIELTEAAFQKKTPDIRPVIHLLDQHHIKIAINNFGAGILPLNYLTELPINLIKIDKQLLQELDASSKTQHLLKAILSFGHTLNCAVMANGVETRSQYEFLLHNKCEYAQGNYLSPPLAPAQVKQFLKKSITKLKP